MSRARPAFLISFYEEITFRALACFRRFTHLPGITQISWRRFRTGIMINARSAKPHTSLALHPSYIIPTRPDEFFRPCHICETAYVENRDTHCYLKRIYMIHSWWPILNETYVWLNKFSISVRHQKETALHNLTQFDRYSWLFGNEKHIYLVLSIRNFNHSDSSIYRNNIMWIIWNEISYTCWMIHRYMINHSERERITVVFVWTWMIISA